MNRIIIVLIVIFHLNIVKAVNECPTNWANYRDKCFTTVIGKTTQHDSLVKCQEMNASLVTIRSVEENKFITNYIKAKSMTGFWLGASRQNGNHHYTWTDGSELTYTIWEKSHPLNNDYTKCAYITEDSFWVSYPCDIGNFDTICEKRVQYDCSNMAKYVPTLYSQWIQECIIKESEKKIIIQLLNITDKLEKSLTSTSKNITDRFEEFKLTIKELENRYDVEKDEMENRLSKIDSNANRNTQNLNTTLQKVSLII
ncbi:macrophage mannose receptor 1-like protein [Leptotrombidium deliense]|uniref:Macrophage mannose receptor 1-like protein n=1 Tax=Leptotrombidium deliense TaxID=299467 RepID=A0A443S2C9_9ACAR|nr:macrophage mannose receptor 1-like protein [Leptotrombidium deliense]